VSYSAKRLLPLVAVLSACSPPADVATYLVTRRAFRQQVTAEGNLKSAKVTKVGVPQEVEGMVRLAWLHSEGLVAEGDVLARFDATDLEDLLVQGRRDLERADLRAMKAESKIDTKEAEHETALTIADLELDHAQRFQKTDEGIYARIEIVEDQIDETLAAEHKRIAATMRDTQTSLGQTELELLAIEKRKAKLKIDRASKGLQALEVQAPHGGLLTWARDWSGEPPQIGAQMWRSQGIAEIPDLSVMEVNVFVLEADAGGLEVGKRAEVVLEAYPATVHVAVISSVGAVAEPRFRGSPVQYFTVTLEIENQEDVPPRPGQRVRARLFLEEAEDALVVPRQSIFVGSDGPYVYVRDGARFASRTIELGVRSLGLVEVTGGLEEGEEVAMARPPLVAEVSQEEP